MKFVIIINGKGAVGKDTICNIVSKYYKIQNISSIDPIKKIAKIGGWDGYKDYNGRLLLSNIKKAFVEYNNLPTTYLLEEYNKFLKDKEKQILFVHIREPQEIEKFKSMVNGISCYTLLIKPQDDTHEYGNESDNGVNNYIYDFIYVNNKPFIELEKDFINYFNTTIIKKEREKSIMKKIEEFDVEEVTKMAKKSGKYSMNDIKNIILDRIEQMSNEWHQEGAYCIDKLGNKDRADVWFTVSEYLNDFIGDIVAELEDLNNNV